LSSALPLAGPAIASDSLPRSDRSHEKRLRRRSIGSHPHAARRQQNLLAHPIREIPLFSAVFVLRRSIYPTTHLGLRLPSSIPNFRPSFRSRDPQLFPPVGLAPNSVPPPATSVHKPASRQTKRSNF